MAESDKAPNVETKDPRTELWGIVGKFVGDLPPWTRTPYFPPRCNPGSRLPENSLLLVEITQGEKPPICFPALHITTPDLLTGQFDSIAVFSSPRRIYYLKYRDPGDGKIYPLSYRNIIDLTCGFEDCKHIQPHLVLTASPLSPNRTFPYEEINGGAEATFLERMPNVGFVTRKLTDSGGILPFCVEIKTPTGIVVATIARYHLSDPGQLKTAKGKLMSTLEQKSL